MPRRGWRSRCSQAVPALTADLYDPATDRGPESSAVALARLFEAHRDDVRLSAYLTLLASFFVLAFGAWLRDALARRARQGGWLPNLVVAGVAAVSALLLVETAFLLAAAETAAYRDAPQLAKTWFVLSWNYANVFAPPALAVVGGTTAASFGTGLVPQWLGALLTAVIVLLIVANMPGIATAAFVVWTLVTSLTLVVRPPAPVAAP